MIRGRTTVAIAHRLSTLRNADRILVFDRGRLIEEGSHFELLSRDGTYARLVRIQTQVSKDPSVDRLLHQQSENDSATGEASQEQPEATVAVETSNTRWSLAGLAVAIASTKSHGCNQRKFESPPAPTGS